MSLCKPFALSWWVAGLVVAETSGAILHLTNRTGGNTLDLDVGLTGDMQIRLSMSSVDTIGVAYLNAFLDAVGTDGADPLAHLDVIGVTAGWPTPPWVYDRSAFVLPTELENLGNEYGLVSGDPTPITGGYPLGVAEYVHDTLTLLQTSADSGGTVEVTFELGARTPQAFGPGPTFLPYVTAPTNFPANFPNFLYVGDANSNNPAFSIRLDVPEPSCLTLLGLAAAAALPVRRQNSK